MRTLTKIGDSLDGVFTLQNRVRKNVVPHGGNWPPLGPPWGPMGRPMGPHGGPHGGPNIWRMGDFAPMGAPISIDGGTVMPMGETNGQRNVLLDKAKLVTNAMGFPHGLWYNGNGMSPWGNPDPKFHLYMNYEMQRYDYISVILSF